MIFTLAENTVTEAMASVKCLHTILLLVALLTMMLFQIASLGLHIADLFGVREDQQNVEERMKQLFEEERKKTQEELRAAIAELRTNTSKQIENELYSFAAELTELTLCNITSFNWRRVAYINMTDLEAECPSGLNEVSNRTTGQRACGRSVDRNCSSLNFPVNTKYTHVCGIARGYQYGHMDAFFFLSGKTIDQVYVDGLSITNGNPRQHLWTYVVSLQETGFRRNQRCPRDQSPYNFRYVPSFVGDHFYCETGFTTSFRQYTAWSDPLWDGAGCVADTAHSCDRHGWFHREIEQTQDDIEVRWCGNENRNNEDVYTDWLEIWVL